MMLFPNKSAFCSEKGKPGLRELQRQAEKRSNHKRSGTTKRFLAELGSLFIEECRQLGTGIKGDELFKTPSFRCGLHFWVHWKKIKRKERREWGGGGLGSSCHDSCGRRERQGGGRGGAVLLFIRSTWTSLWGREPDWEAPRGLYCVSLSGIPGLWDRHREAAFTVYSGLRLDRWHRQGHFHC